MATEPRIGIRIKRARERLRWKQRHLAAALGVNIKTIDNWENDRTYPRSSIGAIEAVLGVSDLAAEHSELDQPDEPHGPGSPAEEALDRAQRELDELRRMLRDRNPKDNGGARYAV